MRVLDVLAARREDVEDEPPAGKEQLVRRRERAQPVGLGRHVQQRAEGDQDERDALLHRRLAHVAEPEVEERLDARRAGEVSRHLEHPGRRVDTDHLDARLRDRHRDPPGAAGELHHRPAGRARFLDVELHVLGDARAPGVVEPRDRVVDAQTADAIVARWTPRRSRARHGPRSPRRTRPAWRSSASATSAARARSSSRCARCATARRGWR